MALKQFLALVQTDCAYIAFVDGLGDYILQDKWGRYEGYELLKAVNRWGDRYVKYARPLNCAMEVVLYA